MTKNEILNGALLLNGDDKKYSITIDGDKIITEVKWMDAVLFTSSSVTDEMKTFKFTVELCDDNTWKELDESKSTSKSVSKSGFGMSYSSFRGKEISFNKTVALGKEKETGETGIVSVTFNSEEYKKPVREYLEKCGCKKAKQSFLKLLFGRA